MKRPRIPAFLFPLAVLGALATAESTARREPPGSLDARVRAFLDARRGSWHDLNVPYADGETLHRLALEIRARRMLEIGTSTGHSTIWLAWAAAKTGGTVTTLEIDAGRQRQALQNFEEAGVAAYVDAQLGNAHELVKTLPGPFDFVFSDADKDWYLQYFLDLDPKLAVGGCFTAHNVLHPMAPQVQQLIDLVESKPNYTTHIERSSPEGILVACKTRP